MLLGCSDGDDDGGASATPTGTTVGSLVAGSGGYVDGIFVWTDYAYDDRGANADAADGRRPHRFGVPLAATPATRTTSPSTTPPT